MTRYQHSFVTAIAALGVLVAVPHSALAQEPTLIAPEVAFGLVHDANLFSGPVPEGDVILRVTPGIVVDHSSARADISGRYHFDIERYQQHPELDTFWSRQDGSVDITTRPTTALTFLATGGYIRTNMPTELNPATGLVTTRSPASEWHGRGEFDATVTPTFALDVSDELVRDALEGAQGLVTNSAALEAVRHLGGRDDLRARYVGRVFLFGTVAPTTFSQIAMAGWTHRFTPLTDFQVLAGPRFQSASRPRGLEVDMQFRRRMGPSEASVRFERTQATAIGEAGVIDVERVTGTAVYHRPLGIEIGIEAGFYRDSVPAALTPVVPAALVLTHVRAIRFGAHVQHPIGGGVSILASYAFDVQLDVPPTLDLFAGQIQRHLLSIQLVVSPFSRPEAAREHGDHPDR